MAERDVDPMTDPVPDAARARTGGGRVALTAGLDAALIVVFAAIGRASHEESSPLAAVLQVAWPFLVGAAAGWTLVRRRSGRWPVRWPTAIPVVACAVAVGMVLRVVTGAGTAFAFVLVATGALATLLIGHRLVTAAAGLAIAAARGRTGQRY